MTIATSLRTPSLAGWTQCALPLLDARAAPPHPAALDHDGDAADQIAWSDDDIVRLHWRLLQELAALRHPATPLADKIDTLRWVFTDPERDRCPFSFANCLQLVGASPLSPVPYTGAVDAERIRAWLRQQARHWLDATLARYPAWVRDAVLTHPAWVERHLARNPQWINEQVRLHAVQRDLFT